MSPAPVPTVVAKIAPSEMNAPARNASANRLTVSRPALRTPTSSARPAMSAGSSESKAGRSVVTSEVSPSCPVGVEGRGSRAGAGRPALSLRAGPHYCAHAHVSMLRAWTTSTTSRPRSSRPSPARDGCEILHRARATARSRSAAWPSDHRGQPAERLAAPRGAPRRGHRRGRAGRPRGPLPPRRPGRHGRLRHHARRPRAPADPSRRASAALAVGRRPPARSPSTAIAMQPAR